MNFSALLAEREAALALLQQETKDMSSYGISLSSAVHGLSMATAEDMSAISSAASPQELEIALIELDKLCRQRRSEKLNDSAVLWKNIRNKYESGAPHDGESPVGDNEGGRPRAQTDVATPEPDASGREKGAHTITLEEFQRKILWEKWTGNTSCPAESEHLLYPLDPAVGGQDISMVKPSAWLIAQAQRTSRKLKQSNWAQSKRRVGDAAENLSFVDFLKSLPVFHSVRVTDLADMERDCPSEAYR